MRTTNLLALGLALLGVLACRADDGVPGTPPPGRAQDAEIRVDRSVGYQTILGWETLSDETQFEFRDLFPRYKDRVLDLAVNDLGINALRLEVRSGAEKRTDYAQQWLDREISFGEWKSHWYVPANDNADPFTVDPDGFQFTEIDYTVENVLLPMQQLMEARGEDLYVTLTYVDFAGTDFEHHQDPDEYAELMVATVRHLDDRFGVVPDAIEVILEPDNSPGWTADRLADAVVATGERLAAAGYAIDGFIVPSAADMGRSIALFEAMIGEPGVREHLFMFSYHRYGGVSPGNLERIGELSEQLDVRSGMLEHVGSGVDDLYDDLTLGRSSLWHQFGLALPSDRHPEAFLYRVDPETLDVRLFDLGRYLRQYFRYVRRGAELVKATSERESLQPLAFVNRDGGAVVVVKTDAGAEFSVAGLPAGTFEIVYTTGSETDVSLGRTEVQEGGVLQMSLPEAGVVTAFQTD